MVISTQVLMEIRSVASRKLQPALRDALIAEAALRNRCAVLFSEDCSHGRMIGGMQIRNPLLD